MLTASDYVEVFIGHWTWQDWPIVAAFVLLLVAYVYWSARQDRVAQKVAIELGLISGRLDVDIGWVLNGTIKGVGVTLTAFAPIRLNARFPCRVTCTAPVKRTEGLLVKSERDIVFGAKERFLIPSWKKRHALYTNDLARAQQLFQRAEVITWEDHFLVPGFRLENGTLTMHFKSDSKSYHVVVDDFERFKRQLEGQ